MKKIKVSAKSGSPPEADAPPERASGRQSSKLKVKEGIFLFLDPGAKDRRLRFFVVNGEGKKVVEYAFSIQAKAIERLVGKIEEKLKEKRLVWEDIRGIVVRKGGESFSQVRGVHTIANALAWSLHIPAISREESAPVSIRRAIIRLRRSRHTRLLIPMYAHAPNIV